MSSAASLYPNIQNTKKQLNRKASAVKDQWDDGKGRVLVKAGPRPDDEHDHEAVASVDARDEAMRKNHEHLIEAQKTGKPLAPPEVISTSSQCVP